MLWIVIITKNFLDEEKTQMGKKKWFIVRLIFSGGLLWLLISRLDWHRLFHLTLQAQWYLLLFAIGGTALSLTLSVFRWRVILNDLGFKITNNRVWYLTLSGFFFNQFLPSTVGGDGYRFLWLSRRFPHRQGDIFTSLLLDRGYGFISLVGVHLILLPFLFPFIVRQPLLLLLESLIVIGSLLLGGGLIFVKKSLWNNKAGKIEKLPKRLTNWLHTFLRLLEAMLGRSHRTVALALIYSILFIISNGITWGIYLRLVGIHTSWLMGLYVSSLAAIVGVIPISVNGLGLMEGVMVLVLEPLGWSREGILLASFWLRGINLIEAALGGILYILSDQE